MMSVVCYRPGFCNSADMGIFGLISDSRARAKIGLNFFRKNYGSDSRLTTLFDFCFCRTHCILTFLKWENRRTYCTLTFSKWENRWAGCILTSSKWEESSDSEPSWVTLRTPGGRVPHTQLQTSEWAGRSKSWLPTWSLCRKIVRQNPN